MIIFISVCVSAEVTYRLGKKTDRNVYFKIYISDATIVDYFTNNMLLRKFTKIIVAFRRMIATAIVIFKKIIDAVVFIKFFVINVHKKFFL